MHRQRSSRPRHRSEAFGIVVGIDEVVASVVWRVDVNHLDLAKVRLLKQLKDFEVVPFDDHVLSRFEESIITAGYRQAADGRAVFKSAATR